MKAFRQWPIGLAAMIGTLASVGMFLLSASWEKRVAALDFQSHAKDYLSVMNTDLQDADRLLATLRAYFESSERPVGRAEFGRFAAVLRSRAPGLMDAGWAPRITAAQRDDFERAVRSWGDPKFEIVEKIASGAIVRAANRPEYYPILYISSGGHQGKPTLGLDLLAKPVRRTALEKSVATGLAAATPPITIITVAQAKGGVISFLPVYRQAGANPGAGPPDGVVFGAFDIPAMVQNVVRQRQLSAEDIFIFDPGGPVDQRTIFWRSARASATAAAEPAPAERTLRAGMHWQGHVDLIDQHWGAIVRPVADTGLMAGRWMATVPLFVGLLLTGMIVAYLRVSHYRTLQLQALTEDLHANTRKISHMAQHDALTGLPNRRYFTEALQQALSAARRGAGSCSVMQIDLDGFKPINDSHGHATGDTVLCEVARRLRTLLRSTDTVARLGGDEFAVLMTQLDERHNARSVAERIVASLGEPMVCDGVTVQSGASIGIAVWPLDGPEPAALLRAADLAMYRAKREHSGYRSFEPAMAAEAA